MTDCPREHEPDTGPQTFKDIVREEFDQESDSIRGDRPHRALHRVQGLVRLQPYQPRQRPPPLQVRLGDLQSQDAKVPPQQSASGPPTGLRRCRSAPKWGRCGRCGRCAAGLKSPNCRRPQSWTASCLALSAALAAGAAGFSKTFSLRE